MPDYLSSTSSDISTESDRERKAYPIHLRIPGFNHSSSGSSKESDESKTVQVTYLSKKTTRGIFKKKEKEMFGGSYEREIAAASGEWVNEFIPNNGKKKTSAKLYVPSTAELLKRNIKRSWTISNPSGTTGPQITPRNEGAPELRPFPKNDLPIIDDKRLASNRPVIVAQIPPPINRMSRPPHPGGAPPNQQVKRNAPVRSQSMGVADTGRFYMKPMPIGGPPPRFRPPPPPDERRPLVNRRIEYIETSSDGEDAIFDPIVPDYRSWDRRKTNYGNQGLTLNQKYKTLEPRSKSGGDSQSLERLNNNRRILPEVPSHSLPRPGKRTQSDSRSRDRPGVEAKRSQSHGDGIGEPSRRKLPPVPGKLDRDLREPTPDYDTSPPPSECSRLTGRRNSDSGLLAAGRADQNTKITVKRHASSVEKVGRRLLNSQSSPENNLDSDDSVNKGRVTVQHISSSPSRSKNVPKLALINSGQNQSIKRRVQNNKANTITRINNDLELSQQKQNKNVNRTFDSRDGAKSANSITFSDLESTRIDFEDPNITQHNIESDNNSDIIIDEKKIVPESSKFKIVFISSESKSGSELNSSLEYADPNSPENGHMSNEDHLRNVKGDFIDEVDWENYRKNKKASTARRLNNQESSPIVPKQNKKFMKTPQNTSTENGSPRNCGDDFAYVNNYLGDQKQRHPSSPSIRTIMTTATKDSNSIPASPHIPKIHNIHIRREGELPPRPRSAMSTTTICSETSIDLEVQNILGSKYGNQRNTANESQEIMIDFDTSVSTANNSFDLNTSADMSNMINGVKRVQTFNNRKNMDNHGNFHGSKGYLDKNFGRAGSARSSADRSLDEMSLYDQMCLQKIQKSPKKDPRVEEYRNLVLAEIKSMTNPGILSRSLSESDLSELGGVSIGCPSPTFSDRGTLAPSDSETNNCTPKLLEPARRDDLQRSNSTPRSDALVATTPSSGYSELTSSTGSGRSHRSQASQVSAGQQGSPINKHGRLEQRLSSSSNNNSPPPVLPPKTRKLQQLTAGQTSKTSPNQADQSPATPDSLGKQQTGTNTNPAAAATVAHQAAQVRATSITKRQLACSDKVDSQLQETFVDDGVSIVRIGQPNSNLNRSASSVTQSRVKHTIAKPVRRSKSQLPGSKFVTNITHGGSVTLVSLNDELQSKDFHPIDPDLTPKFVNRGPGLHSGKTVVSAFQGSNTLPRAGQKKKQAGSYAVDDSEIVITKKLTGGGSSVRIRIGGAARSPTEHIDVTKNWREPELSSACKEGVRSETVIGQDTPTHSSFSHLESPLAAQLSFESKVGDPTGGSASGVASSSQSNISGKSHQILPRSALVQQSQAKPHSISSSNTKRQGGGSTNKNRRKYTLDQIEVEDFRDSNSEEEKQSHLSELSDPEGEVDAEGVASDFDLNSLIEGDVDDDDFGEQFNVSREENEESKTPVVTYFEPLKDPEASVDGVLSEAEFSEEELGSLAVNVGSLHHRSSDTEGDFLDKDEIRKNTLKRVNQSVPGDDEYKSNMADDEYSLCSDMEQNRDKKTVKVDRDRTRAQKQSNDSDSDGPEHNGSQCANDKSSLLSSRSNHLQLPDCTTPSPDNSTPLHLAETTETSDFDSVSTTSASYVVSHSDMESLSLDDHQLDILMNKSDLSDLDQIDSKTITGSGSSDEEGAMISSCTNNRTHSGSDMFAMSEPFLTVGTEVASHQNVDQAHFDPTRALPNQPTDQAMCEGQDPVSPRRSCQVSKAAPAHDNSSARPVGQENCEGVHTSGTKNSDNKNHVTRSGNSPSSTPAHPSPDPNQQLAHAHKKSQHLSTTSDPVECVQSSPKQEGKLKGSVGLSDFDRQGTPDVPRRKGSVSDLIAKFEISRSNTPERSITPESRSIRSATPEKTVKQADSEDSKQATQETIQIAEDEDKNTEKLDISTGARPKKQANRESKPRNTDQGKLQQYKEDVFEPLGIGNSHSENLINNESERAELKGLKEFTQKYLKEQAAKNASKNSETKERCKSDTLGAEGGVRPEELDSDIEDIDMPPTIRRNSGGAYTSYVFISNEPSDEVASVVSSNGSYTDPENRVTVNVKETAVSPNTCVVAIQDGRTSNISIVSTESSELNSPRQSPTSLVDEPPELPTKVKVGIGKDHSELQQIVYATRESLRDYSHRSRGGEELDREFLDDEPEHERSGLANYFTSTLESSFISRRGRPPVIRAAEKVRRQQGNFEYEDESRGMMIDYSDHQPYRESSSTPVLDVDDDMVDEYDDSREKFKITEVPVDDYSPAASDHYDEYDPQVQYDIQYGSGESADEYIEREEYPMCQQVYDSEEYSYSEGEQISSGDEFDREEELRGYNRAIDFTLHTIIEESCEDSEPENRSLRAGDKKRHSDPSELEKYFFYGVGGGNMDQSVYEESEYSDTNSETNSLQNEHIRAMKETTVDSAELASNRLEKYFMTGFSEEKQHSLDAISEQGNTDDSGSVGSESDGTGQPSPDPKRKKVTRPRGFRSERLSDRAESGNENSNVEDESGTFNNRPHDMSYSSESGEDNTAFVSGDGSFDTIKRKKNKVRKPSDDRRSDSERSVDSRRSSAVSEVPFFKSTENSNDTVGVYESLNKKEDKSSPKISPPITPLPSQTVDVQAAQTCGPSLKKQISPSGSDKEPESMKPRGSGSSKESPSTSPPPVGGPVRKHKSRDSGFVGSNDDLLRNEGSHIIISSSDDMQSKNHTESSSEGEHENRKPRLEKVSEVSENTEDDCEKSIDSKVLITSQKELIGQSSENIPRKKSNESDVSKDGSESSRLSRKDSFHQWSSDEETNIMMNRMRTFFKNMLVNASKGKPLEPTRKPTQIVYFEEQLTRLMKTVPGINDQQVKEIVEYLSSEDTWSDSYDSSDYTDYTSSDLEGAPFFNENEDPVIPDMDVEIQEQISASCQEMKQKFEGKNPQSGTSSEPVGEEDEFQKETAIMYQKLMNSVAKMQQSQEEQKKENEAKRSPPIAAKILHHISSRLVTLMHEVSGSDNSSTASISDSRQNLYLTSKDFRYQSVTSSPKPKTGSRRHRQLEGVSSIDSNKSDRMSSSGYDDDHNNTEKNGRDKLTPLKTGEENENSYTFNSLDSPKVLMGPNLGTSPKTNPFKFTKNTSKSVEVLDLGRRRASLDDKSLKLSMAKSTSTDYDVWQGVHRDVDQRRGSLPRGQLESVQSHSSSSGVSEHFDDERFSWKGSFESALAADSRTRLSIEAKRRSIGSDCNSEIFSSVEQMDRSGSHTGSKSSLITSRSPSQSSKRSLKSSLPNSRSSLHISKSEKDITRNSEFSTTPTSELSTKLSTQDSDSDDASGSISSSVRSSISSRYGRRSSVPETTVLARLSEDSPPHSPPPRTIPSSATSITISGLPTTRQHSTNSLPRLGTSAISKSKSTSTTLITSSTIAAPSQPSNIQTSTQGGVRSARYRPHGYKPPPTRKMSPASGGPSRKSSADSIGRFNDDASEISSKSGTPSPLVSRVGMGVYPPGQNRSTSDLLRDFREPSVCSRASSGADTAEADDKEVNEKFGSQLIKAGSLSSLGTRSESMASVYSQGEGRYGTVAVRGDVEFGFIYNFGSGSLDISIKQCKDLAPVDLKRIRSDPYVKVYLLPDRSKAGKRKTKVKKHTLNPFFEEILKFVMPLNEVERRTMWISVWHSDMFGRNDFLGEVMMPMTGQVFDDPSSKWYSLQDRTEPPEDESVINSKGDIIVALKYVPSEASSKHSKKKKGTLMILIKEAKNLPVPKGTTLPDPYCKCYLLPSQPSRGKQKTAICRRTTSPRWEQTICWDDLSIEDVADRSLELAIWDHDRLGHQDFLGGARFNLGTGKHGGRPCAWMDSTGKEITLWQQMLDRPNFWVEGSISLRAVLETNKPEK